MKNRIWTDGEGLTWSTITDLLGDDEGTPKRLQDCVLDLTDPLFEKLDERQKLLGQLELLEDKIQFLKNNIGACISFGRKRLDYGSKLVYFHDKEPKNIVIEVKGKELSVVEQSFTYLEETLLKAET